MMNHLYRVAALRTELQKKKLDAFVSFFPPTIRYFTGFSGSNAFLIITASKTFFLTDFRYFEQMQSEVSADVKLADKGNLVECASTKKIFSSLKAIGVENNHLSLKQFSELKKAVGEKKLYAIEALVENLRAVKDSEEIPLIKKAVEISDRVFQKILGMIKPGISELDISAEISYYHKKFGAENDAFDSIVVSGTRSSLPHGLPSEKKISNREFVTLDFGCIYHGYHSDMTRTICVGTPTAEMKKVYSVVLNAQQKAIASATNNIAAKKLDTMARSYIASYGYGKFFRHSLGHGIGLEIHEPLRLGAASKDRLVVGNVVTIEPGIYLPQKFGVRIEDMVVIRNKGCEVLTCSSKELIVV
ncbi:MAG: Xaa-Pro peptidase family protein [Bacteroidota bacterium]|nr:Xaa-Pro peptidase family protein [Bacteroidota bacterium]